MVEAGAPDRAGVSRDQDGDCAGLTVLEILVTVLIVAVTTGVITLFRCNASLATRRTSNALVAGQLIERQMEQMRAQVARDRAANWPPGNGSRTDSASGVTLEWTVGDVLDPKGAPVAMVRNVRYVARWQTPRPDSVVVSSYVSRDF